MPIKWVSDLIQENQLNVWPLAMFFFVEQIFGENDDYTFGFHIANLSIFLKIILV